MTNNQMIDFLVKMYQNSTEAIFFLDEEGNILSLNPAAEQIIDPSLLQKIKGGNINSLCSFCRGYTSDEHLMTCVHCYLKDPESDFTSFQVYLETNGKGIVPYAASYHMIDEENGVYVFMLRDLTLQYKKTRACLSQQDASKKQSMLRRKNEGVFLESFMIVSFKS